MLFVIEYSAKKPYFFFKQVTNLQKTVGRAALIAKDPTDCEARIVKLLQQEDESFIQNTGLQIVHVSSGKEYAAGFEHFMLSFLSSFDEIIKKMRKTYNEEVIKDIIT